MPLARHAKLGQSKALDARFHAGKACKRARTLSGKVLTSTLQDTKFMTCFYMCHSILGPIGIIVQLQNSKKDFSA